MPFDPRNFDPHPPAPRPEPPRRLSRREEQVLLWGVGLLMIAMLLMPVSFATLEDIVTYWQAG